MSVKSIGSLAVTHSKNGYGVVSVGLNDYEKSIEPPTLIYDQSAIDQLTAEIARLNARVADYERRDPRIVEATARASQ